MRHRNIEKSMFRPRTVVILKKVRNNYSLLFMGKCAKRFKKDETLWDARKKIIYTELQ